ncbi:MAG: YhcH/YjgK/YiaL family protein [Planctomycetia bacterium]|nr:YhcH/YjgK/YiaL family protein [Planctomycetia bacterium]
MFYAKLSDVTPTTPEITRYPKTVSRAIAWLKRHDYAALPLGKTEIEGSDIYISQDAYQTKSADKVVIESHRNYIDIQIMVEGEELMGYATCTPNLPVLGEGYIPERDVMFYPVSVMPFWAPETSSPQKMLVKAGEFCIFAPEDVHASQIFVEEPQAVRKIVVKCRVK